MKDYSKVKFVKPSVDGYCPFGIRCITKGRVYPIKNLDANLGSIIKDDGHIVRILINGCAFLNGREWIPCDENGKELTND